MSIQEMTLTDRSGWEVPVVPAGRMTEEAFVVWCHKHGEVRAEWVDGEIVIMSPANTEHSILNSWLSHVFSFFVAHRGLGMVFGPEIAVRLSGQKRLHVPDLFIFSKSRLNLIQANHLEGAPDLIVEIVSPDSVDRDWREKHLEYQAAGVREYWVVDPMHERVELYRLSSTGEFQSIAEQDGKLASSVVAGFYLRPAWLWRETRPEFLDALRELGVI